MHRKCTKGQQIKYRNCKNLGNQRKREMIGFANNVCDSNIHKNYSPGIPNKWKINSKLKLSLWQFLIHAIKKFCSHLK